MRLGIAAITAGAVSWIGAVNLPLLLGALSEAYGFTPQQLGVFATLAIAGVATGSIATTFLQYRLRRRVITAIGALLVVVANAAATQFEDFQTLALLRFLGECGSGALMAIAVKTISEFGNPSRFFGLMTSLLMVMSLILFFGVAGVIEQYGSDIVYLSHAAFGLPVLAMIVWLNEPDLSDEIPGLRQARPGRSLLAAALGLFAMYAAVGAVWPFTERIAAAFIPDAATIARIIGGSMILSIGGGIAVGWLHIRKGRVLPVTIGAVVLASAMGCFLMPSIPFYILAQAMFNFGNNFLFPYMMLFVSETDEGGQFTTLVPCVIMSGYTVGPLLTTPFLSDSGFSSAVFVGIGLVLLAWLVVVSVAKHLDEARTEA